MGLLFRIDINMRVKRKRHSEGKTHLRALSVSLSEKSHRKGPHPRAGASPRRAAYILLLSKNLRDQIQNKRTQKKSSVSFSFLT